MASASSLPSAYQRQDLKSLLDCSICLETFDDPRTLPCLHSFCKKCLENFVDGKRDDELNCPVCRCKFTLSQRGVVGMTRNHFICNMVEVMSIQQQDKCIPCSHCQQASVGRCVTCEMFMCEKCFKPHNEYPGFQDHVVLTMEELSKPENQSKIKKISKCTKHPNKKLKYYCETCDELICRHCMDFDHDKQHKFSPLEQAAQSKRKDLRKNCEILERSVADSNKRTDVMKYVCHSLDNNFQVAQRLLNERKQELLRELQDRIGRKMNSMMDKVCQVFDQKTERVKMKINGTETFVNRLKASADMGRSLLENGNDEEIVRSCQSVQENLNSTNREMQEDIYVDDNVLQWTSGGIDKMLLAEIKDFIKEKGIVIICLSHCQ